MANKEHRLILDIIKQKANINNQIAACAIAKEFLGIEVKPVPTFRKILFKKVLTFKKNKLVNKRILKNK